jgi:4-amino-4-deoxy-L-arabinose transferase-like glycosyltransferase
VNPTPYPDPNPASPLAKNTPPARSTWPWLLGLWLLLLLLAALRPLTVPDEGRYGEVGRWMWMTGDWLTPRLDGLPFFHKPPLLHWLQAASLSVFGVSAWALRVVPALHAGLMIGALYLVALRISTPAVAWRAALMLGSSLGFLIAGQYVNHDMLVATWIGLAIWCFGLAFTAGERPDAFWARLGFVACALGVLSKGLIGLALPGLVLLVWLVWTQQVKKIWRLPWVSGLALFAAVALPWFVLAQRTYPGFFNYMFIDQQFNRYTAATYNNPQPWWFYLLALMLLLFPWVFFALGQVRRVTATTLACQLPISADWWKLLWAWVGAIWVFFSIPNSKLVGYILPVVPALALLAALGWQRAIAPRAWARWAFAGGMAVNLGLAVGITLGVGPITQTTRAQDVAQVLACDASATDTVYVAGGYPYDLPFEAQLPKAMVVLGDWPTWRKTAGDGWERELFEGASFDPAAGVVLQSPTVLTQVAQQPGHWLVERAGQAVLADSPDWVLHFTGAGWKLYRTRATLPLGAGKGPEAAENKSLPGCRHHR